MKRWPNKNRIKEIVKRGLNRNTVGAEAEQVAELVLRNTLAAKRAAIRKNARGFGGDTKFNAAVSRFAKDRARVLKKSLYPRRLLDINYNFLLQERIPSELLDRLDPERPKNWKKLVARKYKRKFVRIRISNLNFLDDPAQTIQQILILSRAEREEVNAYLDFDDQYCQDIGAFLVIAEIWPQLSRVFRGGKMNKPVQKVLDAVGLGRELNIRLNSVRDHDNIWPFEIRRRRPKGTTTDADAQLQPQGREQLNDRLVELIDEWLEVASENTKGASDWQLSGDGKANIANMVGEILDNAERHSSADGDGDWSMAAFMAKRDRPSGGTEMKCYLAFLSVGDSIAETIEKAPPATRDFCDRYANHHARPGQTRPTLLTIAALQDGVTSSHEAVANRRGGTGLQDTLAFIGDLGGVPEPAADVSVTIISGIACIRLRHPVLVGRPDGNDRRVQWCNAANDPLYPPDRHIAFDLPAHFAGTLVSVAFTLDPGLFVPNGEDSDGKEDD